MKRIAAALQIMLLSTVAVASHADLVINTAGAQAGASDAGATRPNDVVGSVSGWYGANLSVTGRESLTFSFVGSEAYFEDRFVAGSDSISNHGSGSQSFTQSFSAGLLDFGFESDNSFTSTTSSVSNGSNPLPSFLGGPGGHQPNFWVGYERTGGDITGVLLALDDGAGHPDFDYDDSVIRITGFSNVSAVPLPRALGLFGVALGLLMVQRSRGVTGGDNEQLGTGIA